MLFVSKINSYFSFLYTPHGERYSILLKYFIPEFITALLFSSLLHIIDAAFIADLKSTSLYATQGVSSTLIHLMSKITEGLSVGTLVLTGHYNGLRDYKSVGKTVITSLWVTFFLGACIALALYCGAHWIYSMYNIPEKMVSYGVSFLRLRVLGIFFACMYFSLVGFMRGIKNTYVPMILFIIGSIVFIFFDYVLIFGMWGFPQMQLRGSAMASVIQYAVMLVGALLYTLCNKETRAYSIGFYETFDYKLAFNILSLSWPVIIDKATLAVAKIWLAMLIAPMGKIILASFTVIKDMEQFAFVPALACAHVITFLVSNDFGLKNWDGILANIKKIIIISMSMMGLIILIFCLWPTTIIQCFDKKGVFIDFAQRAFPLVSILVICDLLQLVLSAALRGAGDVKTVMVVRLAVCLCFFFPVSYILSLMPCTNIMLKFVLIYASFYVNNGIMSLIYIYRLRGHAWKNQLPIVEATDYGEDLKGRDFKTGTHISHKN